MFWKNSSKWLQFPKFIYFSTTQVYGKLKNLTINEDCNPNPLNAYVINPSAFKTYKITIMRLPTLKCINIRLSNSYGSPIFDDTNCWCQDKMICVNAIEK